MVQQDAGLSLCPSCVFSRRLGTVPEKQFLLCARSKLDHEFVRVPPQPVLSCPGFDSRFGNKDDIGRPEPEGSE